MSAMSVRRPVNVRLTLISGCDIIFAGSIFFMARISIVSADFHFMPHLATFHTSYFLTVSTLFSTMVCFSTVITYSLFFFSIVWYFGALPCFLMIQYLHMLVCPYDVCLTTQSQVWTSSSLTVPFSGQVNCCSCSSHQIRALINFSSSVFKWNFVVYELNLVFL